MERIAGITQANNKWPLKRGGGMEQVAAIILAGGRGTRFRGIIGSTKQKVLTEIMPGKKMIDYTMDLLPPRLVKRVVFGLGYRGVDVRRWAEEQRFAYEHIDFRYHHRRSVMNAILTSCKVIPEKTIVVCNADELHLGLNLEELIAFHEQRQAVCTLVSTIRSHLHRNRIVTVDEATSQLISHEYNPIRMKENPEVKGVVNCGIAVFDRSFVSSIKEDHPSTGWDAIIDPLCAERLALVYLLPSITHFNVGTEEEYLDALEFLKKDSAET